MAVSHLETDLNIPSERTVALHQKLRQENVFVALRNGRIRVSPHLFNSERDIDRLISVAKEFL